MRCTAPTAAVRYCQWRPRRIISSRYGKSRRVRSPMITCPLPPVPQRTFPPSIWVDCGFVVPMATVCTVNPFSTYIYKVHKDVWHLLFCKKKIQSLKNNFCNKMIRCVSWETRFHDSALYTTPPQRETVNRKKNEWSLYCINLVISWAYSAGTLRCRNKKVNIHTVGPLTRNFAGCMPIEWRCVLSLIVA